MKNMMANTVKMAMEVVPRHLFFDFTRNNVSREIGTAMAYVHNKAMAATKSSNESSPEIIGVQLSLVKAINHKDNGMAMFVQLSFILYIITFVILLCR